MAPLEEAQARAIDAGTITNLYDSSLIGFKEARSLLSSVIPHFAEIRDPDLDVQALEGDEDV